MKTTLAIFIIFVSALSISAQDTITVYPANEDFSTGYIGATEKVSGLAVRDFPNFFMFDLSSVPNHATITQIDLTYFIQYTSAPSSNVPSDVFIIDVNTIQTPFQTLKDTIANAANIAWSGTTWSGINYGGVTSTETLNATTVITANNALLYQDWISFTIKFDSYIWEIDGYDNPFYKPSLFITYTPGIPVSGITVEGAGGVSTIDVSGASLQMSANVLPVNATLDSIIWSVSDTSAATINKDGLFTSKATRNGSVMVKATAWDGSGVFGELEITLNNQITLVNDITIISTTDSIKTGGGTLQLYTDVEPNNAYDTIVTWSVVNQTGTASIDQSGLLTAIYNGTVRVFAAARDGSGIKDSIDIHLSGGVNIPVITIVESLTSFPANEGFASQPQTYTVSGVDLTSDITINTPVDFEISEDGISYSSSIILTESSGSVPSTIIYVRIPSTASQGNPSGNITHSSAGIQEDIPVSATINPAMPTITVNHSITPFTTAPFTASASQSYTISGFNLDDDTDLTISVPFGFEISKDNIDFMQTDTLTSNLGIVNETTIFVRVSGFEPPGSITGTIEHISAPATQIDIPLSATINAIYTPLISITESLNSFSTEEGTASSSQNYLVACTNLTNNITITAPTDFEISSNDTTYSSSIILTHTSGNVSSTTIYIRIASTALQGNPSGIITHTSPGASQVDISISGSVNVEPSPLITVTHSLDSFYTELGTASLSQTYILEGSNLNDNIAIKCTRGFEISTDGVNYSDSLSIIHTGGTINSTDIYVRASDLATISDTIGNITHVSSGATQIDVPVSATIIEPAGILDIHNSLVLVYPNPTIGNISIEIEEIINSAKIEIVNMKGSIVVSKEYYNSGTYVIDLSDKLKGLYIIRVSVGDKTKQGKIILQ